MKTLFAVTAAVGAILGTTHRVEALPRVGADVGVSQRTVSWVEPILTAFAFGAHVETDLGSLVHVGPYYLHYELPSNDRYIWFPEAPGWFSSGIFNVLGLRARVTLPDTGALKPYVFAGFGYTWLTYHLGTTRKYSGHFVELPVGLGLAYEVAEKWSMSLDAAYRPAVLHGGFAFEDDGHKAYTGTSLLLAASFEL